MVSQLVVPNPLIVRLKLVDPVCMPKRQHDGDSGFDLFSRIDINIPPGATAKVPNGVIFQIPHGWEGQLRPRSSTSLDGRIACLGTIDSGYRGEVGTIVINASNTPFLVAKGQRISQIAFHRVPLVQLEKIGDDETFPETTRGTGGFGSTGS